MKIGNAKKITALLLALLLAMAALAGCGSGDNTGDDQDGQGDQQGQQEQQNGETGGDTSLQDILDQGEISVAISPDYAPYEYLDLASGEVKGSDIELAKYIAKELGVTLKIEQMNFESCLAAVQSGSCDISTSCLSWTQDRAESMALSEYYNQDASHAQTVLVMKEEADHYKTAADFDGKKIAAQNGTTQWEMTTSQLTGASAEAISVIGDGIMMLLQDKVDGVALPVNVAESYTQTYDEIAIPEFMFDNEEIGNVVATKLGNDALLEKLNEIVKKAEAEGLCKQWLEEATADAQAQGLI